MSTRRDILEKRKERIRYGLRRANKGRHRLTVHRTNLHIYAQVIDDAASTTVAAASSVTEAFKKKANLKNGGTKAAAKVVGALVAEAALAKGIQEVVFDRSGLIYHGRVKELAEAAREIGLKF